jgi:hypothetical protein
LDFVKNTKTPTKHSTPVLDENLYISLLIIRPLIFIKIIITH